MYITLIVAEEPRSKIKTFLTAPRFSRVKAGDTVKASKLEFNVLFADEYHEEDDEMYTALVAALGVPERITAVIYAEAVEWEEEE